MAARERKKSKPVKPPASRRSGPVKVVRKADAKKVNKKAIHAAWKYPYQKPQGLSPEARWMELKPEGWNFLEWFRLFDANEELWEHIYAEAYLEEVA